MGSDDLFHKRRGKSYKRPRPEKSSKERVLIVCEGETETRYFRDFKHHLSLTSVDVKKSPDSAAIKVVNHAIKLFKEDTYLDFVYCVFDCDPKKNCDKALDKIKNNKKFFAIVSVPCFEYWVLLHFKDSTQPFPKCDDVITELKKHLAAYTKNMPNLYDRIKADMDTACNRAQHLLDQMRNVGTDNPTTKMDILVNRLRDL